MKVAGAIVGNVAHGGGAARKMAINPMHNAHSAPRCTGKSKRSPQPCKAPAVRDKHVCRMHGAYAGAPGGFGEKLLLLLLRRPK